MSVVQLAMKVYGNGDIPSIAITLERRAETWNRHVESSGSPFREFLHCFPAYHPAIGIQPPGKPIVGGTHQCVLLRGAGPQPTINEQTAVNGTRHVTYDSWTQNASLLTASGGLLHQFNLDVDRTWNLERFHTGIDAADDDDAG